MLRLMGFLIVIAGSSGAAFAVVKERREYLKRCLSWRELFLFMENEIAFQKSSLPEICNRVGAHIGGNKRIFLKRIGEALESGDGDTFGEMWRREAMRIFAEEPLKKEVELTIEGLGERLCFEDSGMQRKTLSDIEAYLRKHEKEQEALHRERNKLTLCMGVMGGLLITIFFL